MPKFRMLVLSNPIPGREDEYNEWYTNRHIPDLVNSPNVLSGQRFIVNEPEAQWRYAAIYEIDGEVQATMDMLLERSKTPDMPISTAMDADNAFMITLTPLTELVTEAG